MLNHGKENGSGLIDGSFVETAGELVVAPKTSTGVRCPFRMDVRIDQSPFRRGEIAVISEAPRDR